MLEDSIPKKFATTKQIQELFMVEQPELDYIENQMDEWSKELYIMTAEKTISCYEDDYGLDHNTDLTLQQRRARIMAKKLQRRIPLKSNIEEVIKSLLNADRVTIVEQDCAFEVQVETATLVENFDIAKDFFRKIRVAHFDYNFVNQISRSYRATKYCAPTVFTHKKFTMEVQR